MTPIVLPFAVVRTATAQPPSRAGPSNTARSGACSSSRSRSVDPPSPWSAVGLAAMCAIPGFGTATIAGSIESSVFGYVRFLQFLGFGGLAFFALLAAVPVPALRGGCFSRSMRTACPFRRRSARG